MWDRKWQQDFGCRRVEMAEIQGFRRIFNKPSTINRGTPENPGVTLNLIAENNAICTGYAMEFDDHIHDDLFADLDSREQHYTKHQRLVRLTKSGEAIAAHLYIYEHDNVIKSDCCNHLAQLALNAHGVRGSGRDYIINIAEELNRLGIADPEVSRVYQALQRHLA